MQVQIRTRFEITYALASVLAALSFSSAEAQSDAISSRPTFDCAKAESPLALLICSGEETARADWDLRIASWARYFSLRENDRAFFWEDQEKWLSSLYQSCGLIDLPSFSRRQISCVIAAYRKRAELYRSKLTGDALAESRLAPEQLSQIQETLIAQKFLDGEADGEFGPATRTAIRKYQEANGSPQSDYLSVKQQRDLSHAGPEVVQSDAKAAERSAAKQGNAALHIEGEFAGLLKIPADCRSAREFGKSGRWKSQLAFHEPIQVGPILCWKFQFPRFRAGGRVSKISR
jgi:hypothetical protein